MSPELFCLTTGPGQTMVCLYDCFAPQPLHDVSIGIVSYQALLHDVCSGFFAPTPFLLWIVSCQAILNTDLHKLLVIVMEEGVGRVCEGANSMALGCFLHCRGQNPAQIPLHAQIQLKSRYTPKSEFQHGPNGLMQIRYTQIHAVRKTPRIEELRTECKWCRFVTRHYTQIHGKILGTRIGLDFEKNIMKLDLCVWFMMFSWNVEGFIRFSCICMCFPLISVIFWELHGFITDIECFASHVWQTDWHQ